MKINSLILILALHLLSCKGSTDGDFCADIEIYNPSTGKESSYRSIVTLKGNTLYEIHWPNGGHSDDEDFGYPEFDNDMKTSFSDNRNRQYRVKLVKRGKDCFDGYPPLVQCSGITDEGRRCKNKTGNESGRCWRHEY
jgi:hypothetical protein